MNDQTIVLIDRMAEKLGTTSEYLWGVLLKQAPISATITVFYFVIILFLGYGIYRLHLWLREEDEDGRSRYWHNDDLAIPMAVAAIIWAGLFVIWFLTLGNAINGYINPEYWALEKILNSI